MTEEWEQELQSMPFISAKKGRMSALLKMKSKIQAVPKARVQYEVHDFAKRRREDSNPKQHQTSAEAPTQSQTQTQSTKPQTQGNKKTIKPTILEAGNTEMKD